MGNFAENLNLGNRFRPPLLATPLFQTPSVDHRESATALARYPQKFNCTCALPAEVGNTDLNTWIAGSHGFGALH